MQVLYVRFAPFLMLLAQSHKGRAARANRMPFIPCSAKLCKLTFFVFFRDSLLCYQREGASKAQILCLLAST